MRATCRELRNTDSRYNNCNNVANIGHVRVEPVSVHGYVQSPALTLPLLAALDLEPEVTAE